MARNRLVSRARQELRLVRDVRRLAADPGVLDQVADRQPSPSKIVAKKEVLELLMSSLSDDERRIFELRDEGLSWDEVASQVGGSGQARRMQLSRSIERLRQCFANV